MRVRKHRGADENREGYAVRGCVFCTRYEQPMPLFETASLYAMPDRFPLAPGHILIISKEHLHCYGAAPRGLHRELDDATTRVRCFLEDTFGAPVLANETGVVGQTVAHAHLHLTPMPDLVIPPTVLSHEDVQPIADWDAVQDYFARHGHYYYLAWGGQRYVLPSYHSPVLATLRQLVATTLGVTAGTHGIVRAASDDDVRAVAQRWRAWTGGTV